MSNDRAEIEALVRKVVARTLGDATRPATRPDAHKRPLLDEATLRETAVGTTLSLAADTIVTPLARQMAQERHITLQFAPAAPVPNVQGHSGGRRIALGADHGGYDLKEALKAMLAADYEVIDCGTHSKDPVDYPDIAVAVGRLVAAGDAWRGILIDGAGIGSCMAANKISGVRAAMCYDQATAVNSREHNNANVLTLGAGLIGPNLARQIVQTWLNTEFGGGRHAARVAKIDALDGARPATAAVERPKQTKSPSAY